MSASEGRDILPDRVWRALSEHFRFTDREFDVVKYFFDDLSETEIGDALGISPHTVHEYVKQLYVKLDVRSRTELVIRLWSTSNKLRNGIAVRPIAARAPSSRPAGKKKSSKKKRAAARR